VACSYPRARSHSLHFIILYHPASSRCIEPTSEKKSVAAKLLWNVRQAGANRRPSVKYCQNTFCWSGIIGVRPCQIGRDLHSKYRNCAEIPQPLSESCLQEATNTGRVGCTTLQSYVLLLAEFLNCEDMALRRDRLF
jgi:hypothetical protein